MVAAITDVRPRGLWFNSSLCGRSARVYGPGEVGLRRSPLNPTVDLLEIARFRPSTNQVQSVYNKPVVLLRYIHNVRRRTPGFAFNFVIPGHIYYKVATSNKAKSQALVSDINTEVQGE